MNHKERTIFIAVLLCIVLATPISAMHQHFLKADDQISMLPVMTEIPPKTEEMLALLDPDPQPAMSFDDLPSQFSWTNYGGNWVTPVKDQAYPVYCGSCYIFAVWGAFEAAIDIASGDPNTDIDLSEQYGLSCINSGCNGCGGGWGSTMLQNIVSTSTGQSGNGINGVPIESCMPYHADDSIPCSDKCSDWNVHSEPLVQPDDKLFQVETWGAFSISEDNPNDWDVLKTYLLDKGPVAVTIAWTNGLQNFVDTHHDSTDVYEHDDSGSTNHLILLVGWVDDPSIMGGGYWILKNSHGTQQGYGGYCNIAYGCNQLGCSECDWVIAEEWPENQGGPGPVDVDLAVFADFDYVTDEGTSYPHVGDELDFSDTSEGDVAQRSWDFDGDGIIDSTKKNPSWVYSAEGEYEVSLTVVSEWGLENTRTKLVEVREIWPPDAIIHPDVYVDNDCEVCFDARFSEDRDGGQIVSYAWDFDDGETGIGGYITHTFPEPDSIYEVSLTVTDDDGASETETCLVMIDQTVPPVTTINHGFGHDQMEWYGEIQRVSFEATDWSSVIDTFYRIDGGEWKRYVASENQFVPISGEGMHTVEAYSVDYYGNEEIPVSETFGIDLTPPEISVNVEGNMNNGWYDDQVMITVSGEDGLSGFDTAMYKVDAGGWKDYTGGFSVGEGQHIISVVGVDNAGNTIEKQRLVHVDGGLPTSHVVFDGQGLDNMFYDSVELRLVASDTGSGVDRIMYRLDGGSFVEYTGSFVVEECGEHVLECYAVDLLGNQESPNQVSFVVSPVNFVMDVEQPVNALYLFGVKLFSMDHPLIIGPIDVVVDIESFTDDAVMLDHVEILVDDQLIFEDDVLPFCCPLDQQLIGRHTVTVSVISTSGDVISEEMQMNCFIF